jgi:uncharacterized protein (DUF427 family)
MKAKWNGTVLAESDDTVVVEGDHYFPRQSLRAEFLAESAQTSVCPWKGTVSYLDVALGGEGNPGSAWYYPDPNSATSEVGGRVAFWRGVRVVED